MMRMHCDRCDARVEGYPTSVEDNESPFGDYGEKIVGAGVNPVRHIEIKKSTFCRACCIAVLEAYVRTLKLVKGEGGHLADCRWDSARLRYDCADGCEIKKINEVVKSTVSSHVNMDESIQCGLCHPHFGRCILNTGHLRDHYFKQGS